ncbi:hypothetical protein CKAH01_04901 [Colletotrichum kahawae]|uniref:Uncharacterized protein n=1 Tax=Colletotrichum kahawae TaxID=34407 RepID=A0AAE0D7F1_COLKA|nr:hypothetical protein CKAH01_04901 [Colletotrichum kahawae]
MPSDDGSPWQLEQSGRQIHTSRLPTGRGGKSETKGQVPSCHGCRCVPFETGCQDPSKFSPAWAQRER